MTTSDAGQGAAAPHPIGLFGIAGREVELIGRGDAGALGVPVDFVSARRSLVHEGTPEITGYATAREDVTVVPITEVRDLAWWTWTVTFEGVEYEVSAVRDGRRLIATSDSRVVWGDGWDGNVRDGWQRWIDLDGVEVTAHKHSIDP